MTQDNELDMMLGGYEALLRSGSKITLYELSKLSRGLGDIAFSTFIANASTLPTHVSAPINQDDRLDRLIEVAEILLGLGLDQIAEALPFLTRELDGPNFEKLLTDAICLPRYMYKKKTT